MHIATAKLTSLTPLSMSRPHHTPKLEKEGADEYEKRTWRERLHADDDGMVFIPPMMLKNSVAAAAKFLSIQIKGKGKSTYTKHFEAGVLCLEGIRLPVHKNDVAGEWLYLNADGVRGSAHRVMRCMPCIPKWEGAAKFHVLDDTITSSVFEHHLREAGNLIGIGRFRPRNNGFYGRFAVEEFAWD